MPPAACQFFLVPMHTWPHLCHLIFGGYSRSDPHRRSQSRDAQHVGITLRSLDPCWLRSFLRAATRLLLSGRLLPPLAAFRSRFIPHPCPGAAVAVVMISHGSRPTADVSEDTWGDAYRRLLYPPRFTSSNATVDWSPAGTGLPQGLKVIVPTGNRTWVGRGPVPTECRTSPTINSCAFAHPEPCSERVTTPLFSKQDKSDFSCFTITSAAPLAFAL